MIVFDASAMVGAALKLDSVPERALVRAEDVDVFAPSWWRPRFPKCWVVRNSVLAGTVMFALKGSERIIQLT